MFVNMSILDYSVSPSIEADVFLFVTILLIFSILYQWSLRNVCLIQNLGGKCVQICICFSMRVYDKREEGDRDKEMLFQLPYWY